MYIVVPFKGIPNLAANTIRFSSECSTLDFVFNRDGFDWSGGTTFYYWGISGETEQKNYVDNNFILIKI